MTPRPPIRARGRVTTALRDMQEAQRRATPIGGPGVLTNRTTRGTYSRSLNSPQQSTGGSVVPRWG